VSEPSLLQIEERIGERLTRAAIALSPAAISSLAVHLSMVLKWSKAISITSVHNVDESIVRHVIESIAAAREIRESARSLLDIGSGNGYPGLPMKILRPELRTILLEPHLRRSIFLGQVSRALKLESITIERGRIDRPEDLRRFAPIDVITMRGVARTAEVIEGAQEALSPRGQVVLLEGEEVANRILTSLPAGLSLARASAPLPGSGTRVVSLERAPRS